MKKRYWIIAVLVVAIAGLGGWWWHVAASTNNVPTSQVQKDSSSKTKTTKSKRSSSKRASSQSIVSSSKPSTNTVSAESNSKSSASDASSSTTGQTSSYKPKTVDVSNSQIAMMVYAARGGSEMLQEPSTIVYGKDSEGKLYISRHNGESKMTFTIEGNNVKVFSFAQSNIEQNYTVDALVQKFYQTPSEKQLVDNAVAGATVQ